jgi:hypothetical protein
LIFLSIVYGGWRRHAKHITQKQHDSSFLRGLGGMHTCFSAGKAFWKRSLKVRAAVKLHPLHASEQGAREAFSSTMNNDPFCIASKILPAVVACISNCFEEFSGQKVSCSHSD